MPGKGRMTEEIKQKMTQQIETALMKLNHVPHIVSKKRKMAVWSDIREILFLRCVHPRCTVVLSALKSHLRYPASEKSMHPCSPSEQIQFMKQFKALSTGTLLVDLDVLANRFDLMALYDMIKIKHDLSENEIIRSCSSMSLMKKQEAYFQKCVDNPPANLTKQIFLPSIQRKSTDVEHCNEERGYGLINSVLCNTVGGEASSNLIPLVLLKETFPASLGFLEEVVRLYIIGRCDQANLGSVCLCTIEEGCQLSRFMAMQYGLGKQWSCLTSNSLLMSWEEFWQNSCRNKDIRAMPNMYVSVVTLNHKSTTGHDMKLRPQPESSCTKQRLSSNVVMNCCKQFTKQDQSKSKASMISNTEPDFKEIAEKLQGEISCEKEECLKETTQVHRKEKKKKVSSVSKELRGRKSFNLSLPIRINSKSLINANDIEDSLHSELVDAEGIEKAKAKSNGCRCKGAKISRSLQNLAQSEKRVTRSQSQIIFRPAFEYETSIDLTAVIGKPKYSGACLKANQRLRNPDANNSAALIVTENNQLCDTDDKTQFETIENSESIQNSEHYPYDFTPGNNLETASIEIKITPKKKMEDDLFHNDILQKEEMSSDNSKSIGKPRKYREKQELKTSIAEIPDRIPDFLRVKRNNKRTDMASFMDKRQSTQIQCKSQVEKQVNKQVVVDDRARESAMVTKSLELDIPSMTLNLEAKASAHFPYKAKRVKNVKRREACENRIQEVDGPKIQSSSLKRREKPKCKSAGTLPGPLNNIPNKPLSERSRKTGHLPNKIVSNLKHQASNSICSIMGNSDPQILKGIVANGKEIISAGKITNKSGKDFSEFQTERIRMWQNTLRDPDDKVSEERNCKSADVTGRADSKSNYRPTSSIYHTSYSHHKHKKGRSIKTGIGAILSREKYKTKYGKDQMKVESSNVKMKTKPESFKDSEVVSPNYGSSSSKMPDIYDEFARKNSPRACKSDIKKLKGGKHSLEADGVYCKGKGNFHQKICQKNNEDESLSANSKKTVEANLASSKRKFVNPHDSNYTAHLNYKHKGLHHPNNSPFTSNLYQIIDTTLTEHVPDSEIINNYNPNQYTTCSMCRQESNIRITPNNSHWPCSTISTHSNGDNNLSKELYQFNSFNRKESKISKDTVKNNTKNVEDSEKDETNISQEEMSIPINSPMCSDSSTDTECQPLSGGRIRLLDKVNLFVDGIYRPEASESLEDIENIKSVIRINPVEACQPEGHGVCKCLSEHTQRKNLLDNCNSQSMFYEENRQDLSGYKNRFKNLVENPKPDKYLGIPYPSIRYSSERNQEKEPGAKTIPHTKSLTIPVRGKHHSFEVRLARLRQEIEEQTELKTDMGIVFERPKDDDKDSSATVTSELSSTDTDYNEDLRETIDGFSTSTERHNDGLLQDSWKLDEVAERKNTCQQPPNQKGCGLVIRTKGNTCRVDKSTNKTKTCREIVEERRAAKRKADIGQSKKKFWKSASLNSVDSGSQGDIPRVTTHGQKTEIRMLKDGHSNDIDSVSQKTITNKTKKQRTVKSGRTKGTLKETSINGRNVNQLARKYDNTLRKYKNDKSGKALEETSLDSVDSTLPKLKAKRKPRHRSRPKTVEPTTVSERILRPRAIKSARVSRRLRTDLNRNTKQERRIEKEPDTDYKLDPRTHENNIPEPSCPESRSVARQRKLRKRVQNGSLNKKKAFSQTGRESLPRTKNRVDDQEVAHSQSSSLNYEIVDDSYIVCETVPYENILEPNLEPNENDTDSLMKAFITQCSTQDFFTQNQDHNQSCTFNTENLPHTEVDLGSSTVHGVNDILMFTSETPENMQFQYHQIEETGHKNEALHNEEAERMSQYLFYQDKDGVIKPLSEVSHGVLDLVQKDHHIDVSSNQVIHYGIADKQCAAVDPNQQIPYECEKENNFIAILDPDGTKLVLADDNLDINFFPRLSLQEKQHNQEALFTEHGHIDEHSLQVSVGHVECEQDQFNQTPTMITQGPPKKFGDSCSDRSETLPSDWLFPLKSNELSDKFTCVQNLDESGVTERTERTDNNQKSKSSSMTNAACIDPDSAAKFEQFSACHQNTHQISEGKNIGEVFKGDFGPIPQEEGIDHVQLELFPETIIEGQDNDELVNRYISFEKEIRSKYVDFEDELIKMIKENFGNSMSSLKGEGDSKEDKSKPESLNCTPGLSTCSNVFQQQMDSENAHSSDALNLMNTNVCLSTANGLDEILTMGENSERVQIYRTEKPDVVLSELDEVGSMNEDSQVVRSVSIGLQVTKPSKRNRSDHNIHLDVSDSESCKTYDYSARSSLDLYEFDSDTSDDNNAGDDDYYPGDEESDDSADIDMQYVIDHKRRIKDRKNKIQINRRTKTASESKRGETCENQSDQKIPKPSYESNVGHINKQETRELSKTVTERCAFDKRNSVNSVQSEEDDSEESIDVKHDMMFNKQSKTTLKRRGKKKSCRCIPNDNQVEASNDEEEETVEEKLSAKNMVAMQKLYFDILKNASGVAASDNSESWVDIENTLSDGFALVRDRDMTRAVARAERMLEGTGSLEDLEKDDSAVLTVDPSNNCRYQVVEDEDGITLGGVVYFDEYSLPFVYINGYKYTPLKDAATLFQPHCCAWKCRIPKSVMTKNKDLVKTFSTWEQVYKLELIKMKKGPAIKTGDTLVKFDSFVSLLPTLLLEIISAHKDSKLKYSQACDMTSYTTLQSKFGGI